MRESKRFIISQNYFLAALAVVLVILTIYLLKGILLVIIFSFILSYFLFPLYKYILKRINNEKLSAITALLVFTFTIFLPFALLSYFLIVKTIQLILEYKVYLQNPDILNTTIASFFEHFTNSTILSSINYSDFFNSVVLYILDIAKNFFSSIPSFLFNFGMMLFISYYVLIYNKKLIKSLNDYIPLSYEKQTELLVSLQKNLKVLFKGYFLTGLIQTVIAIFGYIIFGAPNLLIISVLTLFFSLIPYLGTPLVWIPVSIYLLISGDQVGGIGLLLYGTIFISSIDNFLRPFLMSTKETISPPLVFIGFIGGFMSMGVAGIILGPLILALTSIVLKFLKEGLNSNS
jgi:predicted PurR-regulated permease PerM